MQIFELPEDLLVFLFRYLRLSELAKTSLVSRTFRNYIAHVLANPKFSNYWLSADKFESSFYYRYKIPVGRNLLRISSLPWACSVGHFSTATECLQNSPHHLE